MGGWTRYWSQEERDELLQHYFDGVPMTCPVCALSPTFRMHHTREVVLLSVRCDNCANLAVLFFTGLIGLPAETVSHQI